MAASEFFILTLHGDRLIYSDLRAEMPKGTPEIFHRTVEFWEDECAPPVFDVDGIQFLSVTRNNLRFIFTTKKNISPTYYLELLSRISQIISDAIGGLTENGIRKNNTMIYELVSEIIDSGYVQSTASEVIDPYVFTKPRNKAQDFFNRISTLASQDMDLKSLAKAAITKGELFVDVMDRVNCVMNSKGQVVSSSIEGGIRCHNRLEHHPFINLKLGALNIRDVDSVAPPSGEGVLIDDMNFHPCVDVESFRQNQVLGFYGPEGQFTAMNFRSTQTFYPPISIFPVVEFVSEYKMDIVVRVVTNFASSLACDILQLRFNTPKTTSSCKCELPPNVANQKAEYNELKRSIVWEIAHAEGQSEFFLHVIVSLTQPADNSIVKMMGPIQAVFVIQNFSLSGITVNNVKVQDKNTDPNAPPPTQWVRYMVYSSNYICRF